MSTVRFQIAISLDGYVAGPNQSMENPLGEGGESLHDWLVALKSWREQAGMDGGEVLVDRRRSAADEDVLVA